ncbi:MAG: carboxypeptidase regulatory-like domain-containing protein [Acidobacteriota bacterium]
MNCVYSKSVCTFAVVALLAFQAPAQTGGRAALHGRVTDPSAASVPGADVILRSAEPKVELKRTTDLQGRYSFTGLAAGKYTVLVTKTGFAPAEIEDYDISGDVTLDFPLTVLAETQQITVRDEIGSQVSVDPNENAGALVLKGNDLEALSDDPDQLQDDLQALAGPSAGPNGGQIFIDGFTGGQLPPKSSIREVRVNLNPFSAEFDRLGFGRVEVFTKPGTDRFRGQLMSMFSDDVFNARNPFVSERPPFQSRIFSGNVSGPLAKKASFTLDVEHRGIDEDALINTTVLDAGLNPVPFTESAPTPQSRWRVVPRVDLQLTPKNSLTARYSWTQIDRQNQGVGGYSLPERAYDTYNAEHTLQLTETAVLSPNAINETRFQYSRESTWEYGNTTLPSIQVSDAFYAGGSQVGLANNLENHYEVQNLTSRTAGKHAWKFGGRLRATTLRDDAPTNFGGTFLFAGGPAPVLDANNQPVLMDGQPAMEQIASIERYRRTQIFLAQGLSIAQMQALGGGPSQFTIAAGNPLASVNQVDVGVFALDDWRLRPNFTLSYGLRYENQTNISDSRNFSPRLSVAWGVDGGGSKAAKTVLRAGFGIFYDRFQDTLTLSARRFNGVTQQQYIVDYPDFYPEAPPLDVLAGNRMATTIRQKDSALRAPYILQSAVAIERQLPRNSTLSLTYSYSRGVHMLRTRDINAPLADGSFPYGDVGTIFQYESTGSMRQNQLIANFNTRFARRVSLFGYYMLNYARSDTDGVGTLPADSYNLRPEWGPSAFDVRHRVFTGGSVTAPWGVMLSPFITASSGAPFNIVSGYDANGDLVFTDRPAFAQSGIETPWGVFNPQPLPGETIIPRNYGRGPGQFSVNVRLSRTWGFGKRTEAAGAPGGGRFGGGGFGGLGRGGRGGPHGMFGNVSTGRRYNLTLGVSARNLFNFVNLDTPVGNLTSALFGQSTALARSFGPASGASNRRIDLQLRFSF